MDTVLVVAVLGGAVCLFGALYLFTTELAFFGRGAARERNELRKEYQQRFHLIISHMINLDPDDWWVEISAEWPLQTALYEYRRL